jgi:multiple sugar transport system substrate-binding protein
MNAHGNKGLVLAVLLLLSAGLLFAGAAQEKKVEYPTTEDGKIKVVYWTHSRHDLAFQTDQVARYNATNKDNVFLILESHTEKITDELNLAFESGQAPDIFTGRFSKNQYFKLGRVADIEPLLKPEVAERYKPWFIEGKNMRPGPDGKYYLGSIPSGFGDTYRFIWNKDLFRAAGLDPNKPPRTFAEMVSYAKKIAQYGATQEPKKYAFAWPGVESDVWEYWADIPLVDSGIFYFDYNTLKYQFSKQKPILEAYIQMRKDGSLFPGILQLPYDPPRAQFAEGNIGMYFAASWDVGVLTEQFPAKIEWGVAPNPTLDGVKRGASYLSGGYESLYVSGIAHPETQKAAVRFLEFRCSLPEQVKYYEGGYGVPIMKDIVANARKPTDPHVPGFAAVDDVLYPRWPPEVELEGENRYEVYNAIVFGKADIDSALADLDRRLNDALDKAFASGDYKREEYRIPGWTPPKP